MKRLSVLAVLIIFALTSQAQNDYGGSGAFGLVFNGDGWLRPGVIVKEPGKNVFKIGIAEAANQKVQLGYERALTDHLSIGIYGLYQIPQAGGSDFFSIDNLFDYAKNIGTGLQDSLDGSFPNLKFYFGDATVNRLWIMPEVRYYFKRAPRGFFASLYFKYRQYDYDNTFAYNNESNADTASYNLNIKMNTASAGISLGFQTFLLKWLSLDFTLFGIQYNSNIGEVDLNIDNQIISSDIQNGVVDAITYVNDIFPVKDVVRQREINDQRILLESRFNALGVRLPSVRLGIRF